jgi:hypothetical protein
MIVATCLINQEEFAAFVERRFPAEHKLYTELALQIQNERDDAYRQALVHDFCRACLIVVNVARPEFQKERKARVFSAMREGIALAESANAEAAAAAASSSSSDKMN